jgi:hypothetical protein
MNIIFIITFLIVLLIVIILSVFIYNRYPNFMYLSEERKKKISFDYSISIPIFIPIFSSIYYVFFFKGNIAMLTLIILINFAAINAYIFLRLKINPIEMVKNWKNDNNQFAFLLLLSNLITLTGLFMFLTIIFLSQKT